jgi:hypothetical protein
MRHLRFAAIALVLFAVAGTTFAGAATHNPAPPKNLRAFLLRPNEATTHVFPRTPSFAWSPVSGARCYQIEVGTSKTFTENSLIWSNVPYVAGHHTSCPTVPAMSIDTALPWFTGVPYALYAHVRAVTPNGATKWSSAFGFNVRWTDVPKPMDSQPGLVRWTPIEGATQYQVWFQDTGTALVTTNTNVADEREYYTFHSDPSWTQTVHWRVRAVRQLFGQIPNGLPAVSYGPWSTVYTSINPPLSTAQLALRFAMSDKITSAAKQSSHELMPGLTWDGSTIADRQYALFRPYAFTDEDCVNVVYTGAVVGSPAYAPRVSGPLALPTSDTALELAFTSFLASATSEGPTFAADGSAVTTNESATAAAAPATGSTSSSSSSAPSSSSSSTATTTAPATTGPKVDLPDLNFPTTRYYWTLVPVLLTVDASGALAYVDAEVPQDACAAKRRASFGKGSAPVTTTAGTPYISGLSPSGRLLASVTNRPVVYGTPLVAWKPAKAASSYEVQWSRSLYPWRPTGTKATFSTSTVLNLKPGHWYYRVRGLNAGALRVPFMRWSAPVQVTVAKPTFRVLASN